MKKWIEQYRSIAVLTALSFIAALLLAANYKVFPFASWTGHMNPRTPVTLTAVPLGTMNKPIQITRTGSIANAASIPIHAEFSGLVSDLYVTEGQVVNAGQPLLKLKASSEPAENQPIRPSSQEAQTNYDNALKEFNRLQGLFQIGAIPRRQVDTAAAHLQQAKENLANAQSSVPSSRNTINGSATINAPIGGIVTGLSASSGKAVQSGQQLLSLGSGQEVEAVVPLDQNDLYLVHLGTPAVIDVSQQMITGQVSRIYPKIEANEMPTFLAHIKLTANPAGILKSGMSVTIRIDTGKSSMVPAVPTSSVFQDEQGRNFIYLVANGKAQIQQVLLGETIGDFTEITSDLPQQSLVITSNLNDIKDGDAVTVMQEKTN